MKLIIDIPDDDYKFIKDLQFYNSGRRNGRTIENHVINGIRTGIPYEEKPQGDLISREALKKAICIDEPISIDETWEQLYDAVIKAIDNAPTVSDRYDEGYAQGYIDGSTGADWKGGAE